MPEPKLAESMLGCWAWRSLGPNTCKAGWARALLPSMSPAEKSAGPFLTSPHQPDPEVVGLNTFLGYAGLRTRLSLWARN